MIWGLLELLFTFNLSLDFKEGFGFGAVTPKDFVERFLDQALHFGRLDVLALGKLLAYHVVEGYDVHELNVLLRVIISATPLVLAQVGSKGAIPFF